jgi:hypothetical protein
MRELSNSMMTVAFATAIAVFSATITLAQAPAAQASATMG